MAARKSDSQCSSCAEGRRHASRARRTATRQRPRTAILGGTTKKTKQMGMQQPSSVRHARSPSTFGAWLGLAAIALHLFAPFAGLALHGATSRATEPAHEHDHAHHGHQDPAAPHAHHGHAANTAAEHAPLNPALLCVGDCPWCSLGDRSMPLVSRGVLVLLPPLNVVGAAIEHTAAPHVFQAGTHRLSRAPPLLA